MDFDIKTRRWLLTCGVLGCVLGIACIGIALSRVEDSDQPTLPPFNPSAADVGTPLTEFRVVRAVEVPESVTEDTMVIGVRLNGVARAYPLNMLNKSGQQVVNDDLGGTPIVATWGDRCFNGRVFGRRVGGKTLSFYAASTAWNDSLVILDAETKTYWSQLTGESLNGRPSSDFLLPISSEVCTWESWLGRYPETTVIDLPVGRKLTAQTLRSKDDLVYGAVIDGAPVHWSFASLLKLGGVSCYFQGQPLMVLINPESCAVRLYSRQLDDKTLRFEVTQDGLLRETTTDSYWDPTTAECVRGDLTGRKLPSRPGTLSLEGKWKVFYPSSTSLDGPP